MKPMQFLMLAAFVLISPTISHAQVAGSTLLGVSVAELQVYGSKASTLSRDAATTHRNAAPVLLVTRESPGCGHNRGFLETDPQGRENPCGPAITPKWA